MNDLRIVSQSEYQQLLIDSAPCGTGSFSNVYRATWCGTSVAVKSFREDVNRTAIAKEFQIHMHCCHSNVVKMLAAGPDVSAVKFIIFELADRGSVAKLLYHSLGTHYTISHAICWLLHVARALDHLHRVLQPSIIHGDVKPDNILLFNGGRVAKLTDFGSATMLDECDIYQKCKQKTLVYAAPELMHFQSGSMTQLTTKCDIYSWAITCWEILARQRPYNNCSPSCRTTFWDVYGQRPPPLRQCPSLLQQLLTRAWDDNPLLRPSMQNIVSLLDFFHHKLLLKKGELTELTLTDESSQPVTDLQWEAEDLLPSNEPVISIPKASTPQELHVNTEGESRPCQQPGILNVLTELSLEAHPNVS